jgi:hypothetical protein
MPRPGDAIASDYSSMAKGLEVNNVYHSAKKLGDDVLWDLNKFS